MRQQLRSRLQVRCQEGEVGGGWIMCVDRRVGRGRVKSVVEFLTNCQKRALHALADGNKRSSCVKLFNAPFPSFLLATTPASPPLPTHPRTASLPRALQPTLAILPAMPSPLPPLPSHPPATHPLTASHPPSPAPATLRHPPAQHALRPPRD